MLKNIFNPNSVALIGASDRKDSVGLGIARNLLKGKRKVFFINPNKKKILRKKSYSKITDLKEKIDLAVIAVPAPVVFKVVKDCVEKRVAGIIIISAGFGERGEEGRKEEEKIKKLLREENIPFIGPNCLGIISPGVKLNASFAPSTPLKGEIAFVSQSGALIDAVIEKGFGFSRLISYGNEAGLSLIDFLRFLKKDKETKVVILYLEALKKEKGKEFIEVARELTRKKPVLALKGGKTVKGSKAARSHSGSLAGNEKIYSTAFKKAGIFEVDNLEDLIDLARGFSVSGKSKKGLAVITNGGAPGVIASDWCQKLDLKMPSLSDKSKKEIKKISQKINLINPVDILGDALDDRYYSVGEILLKQKNINLLLAIQTRQIVTKPKKNLKALASLKKKYPGKNIILCSLGEKLEEKSPIICFNDLPKAILMAKALIERREILE